MPIIRTTSKGKPAFKFGKSGKAFTFTPGNAASRNRAKGKAAAQGRAIKAKGGK